MKLLLTSAGITNESIKNALIGLLPKPVNECNLIFIPTAENIEEGDKWWLLNDLENMRKVGFNQLDIIDFSALPKTNWLPRFEKSDVLWFGGGNQYYLRFCLQHFGLEAELPHLLENKMYGGTSAGSMVAGIIHSGNLFSEDREPARSVDAEVIEEGLGLVNFSIIPHVNSSMWPADHTLKELEPRVLAEKRPYYLLDDNSAVVVNGESVSVVSEGQWKKFE